MHHVLKLDVIFTIDKDTPVIQHTEAFFYSFQPRLKVHHAFIEKHVRASSVCTLFLQFTNFQVVK